MLVLSRKPGEQVMIDGDITITVVQVGGGRVKIGIEAPPHVAVMRGELVGAPQDGASDPDTEGWQQHAALAPSACLVEVGPSRGHSTGDFLRRLRRIPR
jgi:carbon storage regulator